MKKRFASLAVGSAFAAVALAPVAQAADNPFAAKPLASGYQLAEADKKADAKCGGEKKAEAKCGGEKQAEHKCGADKKADGKCGGNNHGKNHGKKPAATSGTSATAAEPAKK